MIVFGFVCLAGVQVWLVWRIGKLERRLRLYVDDQITEERDRMLERVNEDWVDTILLIRRCDHFDRRLMDLRNALDSL